MRGESHRCRTVRVAVARRTRIGWRAGALMNSASSRGRSAGASR